ncbi:MAG: hypothetical protein JXB38_01950, partial [Anaerolineales bacterium]|nr:hypothetical protein [Anaerolineales bacterium]
AAADGSEVLTLYNPDDVTAPYANAQESFVGWLDDETLIAHSADINCGSRSLRTYNIHTGEEQMLWSGYLAEVVFDPSTDILLMTIDRTIEDFCDEPAGVAGVYQLGVDFSEQILIGAPGYPIFREEDGAFYVGVEDRGMMRITTAGQVDEIPAPVNLNPYPSPDGEFWAWGSTDGLWIGLYDEPPVQVGGIEAAAYLRWTPDGSTLFFTDFSAIYRADKPGFTPQVITDDLELTQFEPVWVIE